MGWWDSGGYAAHAHDLSIPSQGGSILYVILGRLLVMLLFTLVLDRWVIRFEERMMRAEFGNQYLEYCQSTRRWI